MILRREVLAAVLPATTSTETGYFLNFVQLEAGGRAVATDGHVLIVATDKHPYPDKDFPIVPGAPFHTSPIAPVVVPTDTIRKLVAATKAKHRGIPILQAVQVSAGAGDDPTVTIAATDLQTPTVVHLRPSEDTGTFPQYAYCIPPADRAAFKLVLSYDVLKTLIDAVRAAGGGSHGGLLTFHIPTEPEHSRNGAIDSAVPVTYDSGDVRLDMVAMPCRP